MRAGAHGFADCVQSLAQTAIIAKKATRKTHGPGIIRVDADGPVQLETRPGTVAGKTRTQLPMTKWAMESASSRVHARAAPTDMQRSQSSRNGREAINRSVPKMGQRKPVKSRSKTAIEIDGALKEWSWPDRSRSVLASENAKGRDDTLPRHPNCQEAYG